MSEVTGDLSGLNQAQRQAVLHDDGPMLVVAGAGTGKTHVITMRIARLIAEGLAEPGQVLALTFTEKAAREMADRLYDMIGWHAFEVPVMTFNAFGAELLGRYAAHIGRSVRGGLINDTQKALLLVQHGERLKLEYFGPQADQYEFFSGVVNYIGRLQNAGIAPQDYRKYVDSNATQELSPADALEQRDLCAIYELYEAIKHETGTYDYHDQLNLPLHILQHKPNLAERLRSQYKYLLVDEYQDTSPVQDSVLRELVAAEGNIFAVGDDDQAIYGFRGADISNILDFAKHFQVKQAVALIENYRSGQPILDAAYRLIRHNDPDRLESRLNLNKNLHAQHSDGAVEFWPQASPFDETEAVLADIASRLEQGASPASIAVIARSNQPLKAFAKALRARDLPFAISTQLNIFEQREIINLWYLLEWLAAKASGESITHVLMGPFIGWSAERTRAVVQKAGQELLSVEDALRAVAADGDEAATAVAAKLDTWRGWAAELPVSQLAYRLVFETGLSDRLVARAEASDRILGVFEDLHRLLEQMQDYEVVASDHSLLGYLSYFPKPPQIDVTEMTGAAEGVQLMSIHASKGLEFDTVYVVGCTARSWSEKTDSGYQIPPSLLKQVELPAQHELRRLLYVAATRAKTSLIITAAVKTLGGQRQPPTPLLAEMLGHMPRLEIHSPADSKLQQAMTKLQRFYPLRPQISSQPLPFESADGWLELGVNALKAYDDCPHEFFLQYVLGISQPFGPQLAFGVALHGVVEAYYQAKLRGDKVNPQDLVARLDELWSERGYQSKHLADAAYQRAVKVAEAFYIREEAAQRRVLGSETKIVLEVAEAKLRLRGRIDAYFQTDDGIDVRDFKTGMKHDAEKLAKDAKDSFQLRCYAMALQAMTGKLPAQVTLDYIVTGAEGSAVLSPRLIDGFRIKLAGLAEGIRARQFAPKPPSPYHSCAAFKYYGTEGEE